MEGGQDGSNVELNKLGVKVIRPAIKVQQAPIVEQKPTPLPITGGAEPLLPKDPQPPTSLKPGDRYHLREGDKKYNVTSKGKEDITPQKEELPQAS